MTLFSYKAVSANGETVVGEMELSCEAEVVSKLQESGQIPLHVSSQENGGIRQQLEFRARSRNNGKTLILFTQQLARLLNAGMPLDRALQMVVELNDQASTKKVVSAILEKVKQGERFSDALNMQSQMFSGLYISLVRAGEASGALEKTLAALAVHLQKSNKLKSRIKTALIYPLLLLVLAGSSLLLLMMYVIPKFVPMFQDMGGEMPLLTQIVLSSGQILQSFWWLFALLLIVIPVGIRRFMAVPANRHWWHNWCLNQALLGDVVTKTEVTRFTRTFGALLINGVSLLKALTIARDVIDNLALKDIVDKARVQVKSGCSLSKSLQQHAAFPKMALQMMQVGEETGNLGSSLGEIADVYDEEVQVALERMLALLVPLVTLGLAAIIGLIVTSMLMAIMSMNDLIL
ncbi:MAG: type II secretion system F family protein [Aestuariibacter sp.]